MNRLCGWLITTMKDRKTIEIDFVKNESKTMTIFVLVSQSPNPFMLGRYLLNLVGKYDAYVSFRIFAFLNQIQGMVRLHPEVWVITRPLRDQQTVFSIIVTTFSFVLFKPFQMLTFPLLLGVGKEKTHC